jgi:hypothetical protein
MSEAPITGVAVAAAVKVYEARRAAGDSSSQAMREALNSAALPHLLTEVKSMCETASKVGLNLGREEGRAEAQGECAAMLEDRASGLAGSETAHVLLGLGQTIRNIASRPRQGVSNGLTTPGGHPDLPEDPKPPQEPSDFIQPWPRIHQAQLDAARRNGWVDFHPEHFCHRCGNRNISWHVDSAVWNRVMRPNGEDGRWGEIICPTCFVDLAGEPHVELVLPDLPEEREGL